MSAQLEYSPGVVATVDRGVWRCEADYSLQRLLNARAAYIGESPSRGDWDTYLAEDAALQYGGVAKVDPPKFDEGRVY